MYIAVDDTDSRNGMCTTYLLTEIIKASGLDVIGFPSLVRLNPAIKYKTRGNGALSVNLGTGKGDHYNLGTIDGRTIRGYDAGDEALSESDAMSIASEVVEAMAIMDDPNTNPGIVVSGTRFTGEFYWRAVREEVRIEEAESFAYSHGGKFRKFKNGRGIIGATAALSWPARDHTYEVLSYQNKVESVPRNLKMAVAERFDSIELTFNNIDRRNRYPAIFPKERTPVLFGVRGLSHQAIMKSHPSITAENGLHPDRYLCYLTNQGTDDHIIFEDTSLDEGRSYSLVGQVIERPVPIKGSHYFSHMIVGDRRVGLSAYEPTKEFREVFRELLPGDTIRVFGTYIDAGINIEKMEVIALSTPYSKSPPSCDTCGRRMSNRGAGDYRCTSCKTRKSIPSYSVRERKLKTGKYDVPVIARRHLSRPFELENLVKEKYERRVKA